MKSEVRSMRSEKSQLSKPYFTSGPVPGLAPLLHPYRFQIHMVRFNGAPKEYTGMVIKVFSAIRGIKQPPAVLTTPVFYFRMSLQIIGQAVGHNFSLAHYTYPGRQYLFNFFAQQRVMRTGQQQSINI